MSSYTYKFPALRGVQAGRKYYVAMCPLKLLPKIFIFDEASLPPDFRAQRTLNLSRIPEITRYVVENHDDYAFSAITASIDSEIQFETANGANAEADIGHLVIPMSARFIINDGQHRRAAIEAALEERPELGNETIAVVFFLDTGLKRTQQLFADLNKHAVKPTKSLGILYDYRDPLACLSRNLMTKAPCFKGLTEKEKTTISNRSYKVFTLSAIYQATSALLDKRKNQDIEETDKVFALAYWVELAKIIPQWKKVVENGVKSSELRMDYVNVHSILLHALGHLGNTLRQTHPSDWKTNLQSLRGVDWSRSNTDVWEGRAMNSGRMGKSRQNEKLTAIYLKQVLSLPLTSTEQKADEEFQAILR
jgi:DNA sulfur modification protein DndB